MPVYFEPRKRKNRLLLPARHLRFGTMLLAALALLTGLALVSPPETPTTATIDQAADAAVQQPFNSGVFGVVLESTPGTDSMTNEFLARLANAVSDLPAPDVIVLPSNIRTSAQAQAVGETYGAGMVVWMDDSQALLKFTLTSPDAMVAGNATTLQAVMVPQEFALGAYVNTDMVSAAELIRAMQRYHGRNYAEAAAMFESLLMHEAGVSDTMMALPAWILHLYHGNALFQQGNCPAALVAYAAVLEVDPVSDYALFNQGSVYYQQGDVLKAWQIYDIVSWYGDEVSDDQAAVVNYSRGRAAEQARLYDIAVDAYTRTLTFDKHFQPAQNRLDALKRQTAAQKALLPKPETSVTTDSNELYDRAVMYIDRREFDLALRTVSEAIRHERYSEYNYNLRGFIYSLLELDVLAVEDFNRSLAINPIQGYAYMGRGYAYAALGNVRMARLDFQHALRISPDYAGTYIAWGLSYQMKGDYRQAGEKYWDWMQHNLISSRQMQFVNHQARLEMTEGRVVYLTVTAKEGQLLSVVAAAENPYLLDPMLVILNPAGRPITGNDDRFMNKDFNAELVSFYIPADGTYTIAVSHAGGGSEGNLTVTYSVQ
jgi:tetratricopeptide (TPR) repeat protein